MMETIVKAIPVILMAGILLFVVAQYIEFGGDAVDRESCRDSILLKERSKTLGTPLIGDINCKTNLVEIDSEEENKIYEIIAGEMYDCWHQFNQGKSDFLDKHDFGRGDNWCFVCSRIDFSKDVQEKFGEISGGNVDGFLNYLSTEKIPPYYDETFYEYLYGEQGSDVENLLSEGSMTIDASKPIYISFLGDKRVNLYQTAKESSIALGVGTVGGCLIGGAIGLFGGPFGAVAGCAGAAKLGAASAMLFSTYEYTTIKHDYVSLLYVGDAEGTRGFCNV